MSEYTDYYADLLILQYKTQPKARATISALTEKVIADGILLDVINGFNLLTAEGKQLDILGKYIGLSRNVKEKIGSPATVILTDDQYRLLLQLKLICNTSYSATYGVLNMQGMEAGAAMPCWGKHQLSRIGSFAVNSPVRMDS